MAKALRVVLTAAIACSTFCCAVCAQEQDPPTRAARLSYVNGTVSMQPSGVNDWAPAEVNRPFATGDYLYTDQGAVAELHLDSAVFRMGQVTSFGFLNLNDQIAQLKLTEGDLFFRVRDLAPNQVYEIDTPNAAINLLRDGVYRLHVDPQENTSFVSVREGQAEVTGGGQAFTLNPGQGASLSGSDQLAYQVEQAPAPDAFDDWCLERDQRQIRSQSAQYVPPSVIGYEDLDNNGDWAQSEEYGPVWYPTRVDPGWAPYSNGHWAWVEPWGWTWVDAEPWGFAPSHYGRWVYWHERWGWAPGPVAVIYREPIRPVYAPALVAWFGGAHWGVSISAGGGPSLGWVPLGYGELYTPSYRCSPRYFENVNVNNTRVVNTVNITNVYNNVYVQHNTYNTTYVNARAPRAVTAMPASAFASGRPVGQAGFAVRPTDFARASVARVVAPAVVPARQAVAPNIGRPIAHPDAQSFSRQVVARAVPPTPIAPFAARQTYLQQHAGSPHDFAMMHQTVTQQAALQGAAPVPAVRQAPAVRPVEVSPGQRGGGGSPPASNWRVAYPSQAPKPPVGGQAPEARQVPATAATREAVPAETRSREHGVPPNRAYQDAPPQRQPQYGQRPNAPAENPPPQARQVEAPPPGRQAERPAPPPRPAQVEPQAERRDYPAQVPQANRPEARRPVEPMHAPDQPGEAPARPAEARTPEPRAAPRPPESRAPEPRAEQRPEPSSEKKDTNHRDKDK